MKQHITTKQLNELSENGKEKLREWELGHLKVGDFWCGKPQSGAEKWLWDGDTSEEYTHDPRKHKNMFPILSIGQMIELLTEEYKSGWPSQLPGPLFVFDNSGMVRCLNLIELCDALWQAVKEVLDK